jgi:hypothetical protein
MAVRLVVLLPLLVQQAAQSRAEEGPQRPPLPLLQVTVINCTRSGASFLQPLVARVGASGGTTDRVNLPSLIESIDSDFAGGELGTAFAEASITSPTRGMTSAIAPLDTASNRVGASVVVIPKNASNATLWSPLPASHLVAVSPTVLLARHETIQLGGTPCCAMNEWLETIDTAQEAEPPIPGGASPGAAVWRSDVVVNRTLPIGDDGMIPAPFIGSEWAVDSAGTIYSQGCKESELKGRPLSSPRAQDIVVWSPLDKEGTQPRLLKLGNTTLHCMFMDEATNQLGALVYRGGGGTIVLPGQFSPFDLVFLDPQTGAMTTALTLELPATLTLNGPGSAFDATSRVLSVLLSNSTGHGDWSGGDPSVLHIAHVALPPPDATVVDPRVQKPLRPNAARISVLDVMPECTVSDWTDLRYHGPSLSYVAPTEHAAGASTAPTGAVRRTERATHALKTTDDGATRVCPVVLGGPNHPVLDVTLPGLPHNLSGGFENGAVVKVDGIYHMVVGSWSAGATYSHDKIVQFSSPDKYNWTFGGQIAGCRWQNGQWYNPAAQPALFFSNDTNRWELFHIWCIEPKVSWAPNCTVVRMISTVAGRSGITGPWEEDGIILTPEGSQPWQDGELDSISNPFKVGDRWLVFIGSGGPCGFCVGLASAPNISGPYVRLTNRSAVLLINGSGTAKPYSYNENPLVTQLASGVYVSVFDFLKPEVTRGHDQIFGFSFSTTGVDWPAENGVAIPLLPRNASGACSSLWTSRARTPLSLVDEGDGTYTMFYTGFGGAGSQSAAVSFVSLAFESVPLQPPQPPPPPPTPVSPGSFISWVRECGVSVAVDVPISGNSSAPVLGTNVTTEAECRALCEAHDNCTMYVGTYGDGDRCTLGEWCWICFGRTDSVWRPVSIPGIVSARRIHVALPPPPPQHQCLKTSDDDASVGRYWRQRSVDFKVNNRQPAWSSALRTSWDDGRNQLATVPNVTGVKVYNATASRGLYSHAPMISYHDGLMLVSWKNHNTSEDSPGQFVRWAWSKDGGATYSEPATLFPNVSDGSEGSLSVPNCSHTPSNENTSGCAHLFAEPTLVLGAGRHIYMAASLRQFCLYPYPWPGRRNVLLRRVSVSSTQHSPGLGPAFWLDGVPPGFEAVSERRGLVPLTSMDATTQQDIAQLDDPQNLPCAAGAKCEACVGGCQRLEPLIGPPGTGQRAGCDIDAAGTRQSFIERSRYTVPGGHSEVLLYRQKRSKDTAYFCFSARDGPTAQWSEPAPSGIPDCTSNMNAGVLPDGRVFVLSNPSTRETLVISLSHDGFNFSHAFDLASCNRAPFSDPRPPTSQPDGCTRRNPSSGHSAVAYPQAVVVAELGAMFVTVSNSVEDIWVLKVPLASLAEPHGGE